MSTAVSEHETCASSAFRWDDTPWFLIKDIGSTLYKTNRIGPKTGPCEMSQTSWVISDLADPQRTHWYPPVKCDGISQKPAVGYVIDAEGCLRRRRRRIRWSTVSMAADKSNRIKAAKSPGSIACRIYDSIRSAAVSVGWPRRHPDCNVGGPQVLSWTAARRPSSFDNTDKCDRYRQIWTGCQLLHRNPVIQRNTTMWEI